MVLDIAEVWELGSGVNVNFQSFQRRKASMKKVIRSISCKLKKGRRKWIWGGGGWRELCSKVRGCLQKNNWPEAWGEWGVNQQGKKSRVFQVEGLCRESEAREERTCLLRGVRRGQGLCAFSAPVGVQGWRQWQRTLWYLSASLLVRTGNTRSCPRPPPSRVHRTFLSKKVLDSRAQTSEESRIGLVDVSHGFGGWRPARSQHRGGLLQESPRSP